MPIRLLCSDHSNHIDLPCSLDKRQRMWSPDYSLALCFLHRNPCCLFRSIDCNMLWLKELDYVKSVHNYSTLGFHYHLGKLWMESLRI